MRGTHVASFAHAVVEKSLHEDSAWQSLEGLKKVYKKYTDRVDTACRIALKNNYYTVQEVKKILKGEEDLLLKKTEEQTLVLPFHANIRGASYYTQSEGQV